MQNNGNLGHNSSSTDTNDFRDYVSVIRRGKWIIAISFLSVFLATLIFTLTSEKVYEATTSVLIDKKMARGAELPFLELGALGDLGSQKDIANETEILKTRALAETVVQKLKDRAFVTGKFDTLDILSAKRSEEIDPGSNFAKFGVILGRLSSNVSFTPVRESDVITITTRSNKPKEAALIANTYAQAYYERNLSSARIRSRSIREFLELQMKTTKESLDRSETSLQDYMEKMGIVSLDDEAEKLIEVLSQFQAERHENEIQFQSASKMLQEYKDQLTKLEPAVAQSITDGVDPYIGLLQESIAQLEIKKDETVSLNPQAASTDVGKKTIGEIDDQITTLRKKLQQKSEEYVKSALPVASNQIGAQGSSTSYIGNLRQIIITSRIEMEALTAKRGVLDKVIAEYDKDFQQIPKKSITYARLQRDRMSDEKLYLLITEKYQESVLSERSEFGYVDIIDPAVPPGGSISPKVTLNIILGIILGLGLGIGIVFTREYLDARVRTPEDLKKRGYTILSTIPLMLEQFHGGGERHKVLFHDRQLDSRFETLLNPFSTISESYRRLRTSIQFSIIDRAIRTLLVTSSGPSEGKSTTVANLAITFAQAGNKTLLVDSDLRRPIQHTNFDLHKEPGFVDYMFGNATLDQILQTTSQEDLYVVTSGTIPPNPSELLGSSKMKEFLSVLSEKFDRILFDSPPEIAATDAVILSTLVDGVVFVVSAGETHIEGLEKGKEMLDHVGAKVLGIVVNNFDARTAGYYGYYGYYGNYGDDATYGKKNGSKNGKSKKRLFSKRHA